MARESPDSDLDRAVKRSRIGWWALFAFIGAVLGYLFVSYLGTFVAALFVYYGVRPLHRRIRERIPSADAAATVTILLIVLPIVFIVGYTVWSFILQFSSLADLVSNQHQAIIQPFFDFSNIPRDRSKLLQAIIDHPQRLLEVNIGDVIRMVDLFASVLFRLSIVLALVFYLLRDDHKLAAIFRSQIGGRDSAVYAYAVGVDRDIQLVYFGNLLIIFVVGAIALIVYYGYNYFAPLGVSIPLPTVLALLTGISSLIPIIVSKVVYVPLTLYLGVLAFRSPSASLWYPATLLIVSFLVLDIIPQTFIVPQIAGRRLHVGLVLLSYLFGTALFGLFGLFLGPLILVLLIQFIRIAFGELIHGEPITPEVTALESTGTDPRTDAANMDTSETTNGTDDSTPEDDRETSDAECE